ncbi:hypothetical protein EC991_010341 [Linnemannia zychae]|nr:hypothetical protein EC991_010341 [Linnemannia zychae]
MIFSRSLLFGLPCYFLAAVSVSAIPATDTNANVNLLSNAGTFFPDTIARPGPGGPGGPRPRPLQCTNPGFFCKSTVAFAAPNTSPNPNYGGGPLAGNVQADQFICPSSDAYAVRIASCPQGGCQQNYCIGGGPAKVPERLPSGNGLYCGKTLNAQYTSGLGGGFGGGSGGGGGGGGGGGEGGRPPRGEYVRNNLYYFIGSYGVNLGPCPYQCVNAGPGTSDYCATSAY